MRYNNASLVCPQVRKPVQDLPKGVHTQYRNGKWTGAYQTGILIDGKLYNFSRRCLKTLVRMRSKVLKLRAKGWTAQEIREELGVAQYASKYKGVHFHKPNNKWIARPIINGEKMYLGIYKTEEEAYQVVLAKRLELSKEF